jgi:hypothetical protein
MHKSLMLIEMWRHAQKFKCIWQIHTKVFSVKYFYFARNLKLSNVHFQSKTNHLFI